MGAMNQMDTKLEAFGRLLKIMDELRTKCPWDKKQTLESLRHLTIEETYELTDAITNGNYDEIKKELGDLILHVVFYSRIASENNHFDITDVLNAQCDKLITRHPHIYGDTIAETEEQVKQNWEQIKLKEGNKGVLAGVPVGLPAVVKALRMQEKAAQVGFDWPDRNEVVNKVREEWNELEQALSENNSEEIEAELGDVLFSIINWCRHAGINPENALQKTNQKFKNRFEYIEKRASESGKKIHDLSLEEMDNFWNEIRYKT